MNTVDKDMKARWGNDGVRVSKDESAADVEIAANEDRLLAERIRLATEQPSE